MAYEIPPIGGIRLPPVPRVPRIRPVVPTAPDSDLYPGVQSPARALGMGRRPLASFKRGGKVKKTGIYKLHRGESVVPLSSLARARRNV